MKTLIKMLLIFSLAALISCGTSRNTSHESTHDSISSVVRIDSVIIKEVVRDTTFIIEEDSALLRAMIQCDSNGRAYISEIIELRAGRNVRPNITISNGVITAECIVDSMAVYMYWKERYERVVNTDSILVSVTDTEITTTKIVKRRGMWWFLLLIPIGAVILALKYFKII